MKTFQTEMNCERNSYKKNYSSDVKPEKVGIEESCPECQVMQFLSKDFLMLWIQMIKIGWVDPNTDPDPDPGRHKLQTWWKLEHMSQGHI